MFTAPNRWMALGSVIGGGFGSYLGEGLDLQDWGWRETPSVDSIDVLHLRE